MGKYFFIFYKRKEALPVYNRKKKHLGLKLNAFVLNKVLKITVNVAILHSFIKFGYKNVPKQNSTFNIVYIAADVLSK
jgi:hypothetical protein